jgi:hypothetical protein
MINFIDYKPVSNKIVKGLIADNRDDYSELKIMFLY